MVYDLDCTAYSGGYDITIGEPVLCFDIVTYTLSNANCVKGTSYSWPFILETPNGRPAYVEKVCYSPSGAGWPIEGGYYSVVAPGGTIRRTNTPKFYRDISFNFSDLNTPLVRADGQWDFGFTAAETGTLSKVQVSVHYWYEL